MGLLPIDGDHDVAVPRGLARGARRLFLVARAGPEIEHLLGRHAGVDERDDRRIMPQRIVLGRKLDEIADIRFARQPGNL